MRILWITNIPFPAVSKELNLPPVVVGGWMLASAQALAEVSTIQLAIATLHDGKELKQLSVDGITYYMLPKKRSMIRYDSTLESYWREVKEQFQPDVVHLHGTEYAHGVAYVRACGSTGVVCSIQGLISIIGRYYYAGISIWDCVSNYTLRDVIRGGIFSEKRDFEKRGKMERELLSSVSHIIGRTAWDRVHAKAINPNAAYHFCNETLRSEFYKHQWSYEACQKHTIFLSQAGYPIKGLHQVLKALPLVLRKYPDTKIVVAGQNILETKSLKQKLKQTGYARYLKKLIKQYGLSGQILFTGILTEQAMCAQYLNANVFVCPSAIENSPNSLGEAQLLGMPTIAAYVGGVPTMAQNTNTLLYRFEEVEMLADAICEVFSQNTFPNSHTAKIAGERHDRNRNNQQLIVIYHSILGA